MNGNDEDNLELCSEQQINIHVSRLVTKEYSEAETARINLMSHLIEGQKILGIGSISDRLCLEIEKLGFEVYWMDINKGKIDPIIDSTKKDSINIKTQLLIGDESKLAIKDNSIDSLIIAESLPQAKISKQLLHEALRVVRNGGRIIISIPDDALDPQDERITGFSKDDLIKELNQYAQEIDWHSLPFKSNWAICSLFIDKHISKISEELMIDVIMPTFNGRKSIRRAMKSLLNQTYRNWNLIVVNDGGEDIKDIIDEFQDNRIKYIISEHRGKSHALNIGINSSCGEFISYLDDDDILYPIHLEVLMKAASDTGHDFLYDDWYEVYKDEYDKEIKREFAFRHDVTPSMLILRNYINHKCVLHKRSLLEKAGMYDEGLDVLIDWDMIRRLSFASRPYHVWCVTSEHIQYYKQGMMENKITSLWRRDPVKAKRSLEKIIKKTVELPATEEQLKESVSEAMLSFSYYHQLETGQLTQNLSYQTQNKAESKSEQMNSDLRSQLHELNSDALSLKEVIKTRDAQMATLSSQLHELQAHASLLEDVLKNRDAKITTLSSQLQELNAQVSSLEHEIAEMKRSAILQITMKFHHVVVERMLPQGTRRRRWYDLGLKGGRIFINDGPKQALREFKVKIQK